MSSYTPSGLPFESRSYSCDRHPVREEPERCTRCDHIRAARRIDREQGEYSRRIIDLANGEISPHGSFTGRNSARVRELYNECQTNTDRTYEDLYSRDLERSGRDLRDILMGGSERSLAYGGSGYNSSYGPGYVSTRDRERERNYDSNQYGSSRYSSSRDNYESSRYSSSWYNYGNSRGYSSSRNDYGSREHSSSSGRLGQTSGYSFQNDPSTRYPGLPGDEGYSRSGRRGAYCEQEIIYIDNDTDEDY